MDRHTIAHFTTRLPSLRRSDDLDCMTATDQLRGQFAEEDLHAANVRWKVLENEQEASWPRGDQDGDDTIDREARG